MGDACRERTQTQGQTHDDESRGREPAPGPGECKHDGDDDGCGQVGQALREPCQSRLTYTEEYLSDHCAGPNGRNLSRVRKWLMSSIIVLKDPERLCESSHPSTFGSLIC